jgi:hypothetical protein
MAHTASGTALTERPQSGASAALATVVYRSRAVAPLPDQDLQHLIRSAQSRNQREAITGVVLYDDSRFFQWLEGPVDGVARVMDSILSDARHTDLEILTRRTAATRRFKDWNMKLAAPGAMARDWRDEVIEPPPEIIADLRRQPAAAPSLLIKLVPLPKAAAQAGRDQAAVPVGPALGKASAAVLKSVIVTSVIPVLLRQHGLAEAGQRVNPRAAELAELLVAADQVASLDLIRELRGRDGDVQQLFAPLLEPAARSLGDLLDDDICSEFDLTLGLCRLQAAVRLLGADRPRVVPRGRVQPNVLVAPMPGEMHNLVASFDCERLWHAGWSPQIEFPRNDRALEELLSASWIDVLDLSLSAASRREDSLPRLTRTITQARRASRNPALVVIVGGRAFVEDKATNLDVGADLASRTSQNVEQLMLRGMRGDDAVRPIGLGNAGAASHALRRSSCRPSRTGAG